MKQKEKRQRLPEGGKRSSKRLLALDAARGLAVIGMFVQHFALNQTNSFVSGNTMILFMLCSGISYTLMGNKRSSGGEGEAQVGKDVAAGRDMPAGKALPEGKESPGKFRTRVLARSVFIDLIGYFLIMLNGPFAVVLPAYAMLFLLALFLIRRSTKTLVLYAVLLFLLAPPLMMIGLSLFSGAALLGDIAGGPLSALAWMPVFVTGMAIGRLNLKSSRVAGRLAALGAGILIPSRLFAVFCLPGLRMAVESRMLQAVYTEPDPYAVWPGNTQPVQWHLLFMDMPQGGSLFELLIGTGGALILLGLLLLLEKRLSALYRSFACVGQCALTLYVLQFLIAWGAAVAGVEVTSLDIGSLFLGDVMVAAAVTVTGCLLVKLPCAWLEGAIRRFTRLFECYSSLVRQNQADVVLARTDD